MNASTTAMLTSPYVTEDIHSVIYHESEMIWGLIHLLVGMFALTANALVLLVYYKTGLKVPLNTLFAYIALCDMVSSLPALYSGYFMMAGRPKVRGQRLETLCIGVGILFNWMSVTLPMLIAVLSICRFIAIKHPTGYRRIVTLRFVIVCSTLLWCIGIFTAVSPFAFFGGYSSSRHWTICDYYIQLGDATNNWALIGYDTVFMILPVFGPLSIMLFSNACIVHYIITGNKSRSASMSRLVKEGQPKHHRRVKRLATRYDLTVTRKVLLITLSYLLCYGLWLIYYLTVFLDDIKLTRIHSTGAGRAWAFLMTWYTFAAYLNSATTPFIHWYGTAQFQQIAKTLPVLKLIKSRRNPISDTTPLNTISNYKHCKQRTAV